MTPKEKAVDLVCSVEVLCIYNGTDNEQTKLLASLIVDEIRSIPSVQVAYSQGFSRKCKSTESYWVEVRNEIEKL